MDEKAERPRSRSSEDLKLMYKDALDLIKQIEVASVRCTKLEDVFAPDLLGLRYRFREISEKLICTSPQQYGKVVREKLWRYAFYDVICRARRFVKGKVWEPLPKAFITQHLYHGVGYLNVMLMKLEDCQDFQESKFPFTPNGIDAILPNRFEELKLEDGGEEGKKREPPKWLTDLLFFIHINIGDLYRYLTDILAKENDDESKDCLCRAMEYYLQAFVLYPDYGLAMNQIGNLSVKVNYGVDTTYYMLHSMLSVIPYEGAAPNLRNHLESCLVHYAKLPATYDAKPIEIFCNMLLKQVHNFLYENLSIPHFSKNFSDVIVQFQERLASADPDLNEQLLFRIACISVYTFWQLQAQNSTNISLAVAFATAMFSQILARVAAILEKHSYLKQCARKKSAPTLKEATTDAEEDGYIIGKEEEYEPKLSETLQALELDNNIAGNSSDSEDDGGANRFNAVLRRNRRRKVFKNMLSGSSSEGSGSEDEQLKVQEDSDTDQSDWTDSDEEYSESDYIGSSLKDEIQATNGGREGAFESSSPHSCSDSVSSDHLRKQEKVDSGKASESSSASAKETPEEKEMEVDEQMGIGVPELKQCRSELEPLLVALLPFIKWIETSPGIKDAFAANCGKEYVSTLCTVFNLLLSECWEDVMGDLSDEVKQNWQAARDGKEYEAELFKWQLPEDRSLMGLPHFQDWIKSLEDNSSHQKNDLLITRMGRIVNFGQWMVSTKCFWIAYDGEPKSFKYQSPRASSSSTGTEKIKRLMDLDPASDALSRAYIAGRASEPPRRNRRERSDRRRGRRRRDPADEVKDAGSIVYIIVDLPAVLYYLKNIQKLANKRRFVVVFPQPVWKVVDEMKEARGADATAAIRASEWIRSCITRDHKGVRCLRDHENSVAGISVPKNLDKKGRQFFNMMESCNYLLMHDSYDNPSSRTFFGDMRDKFRVICLSGYEDILTNESMGFSPIAVARGVGTFVDLIEQYPPVSRRRKWRKSKSNG